MFDQDSLRLLALQFFAWLGGIFFYRTVTHISSEQLALNIVFTIGLFVWCIFLVAYITRRRKKQNKV